MSQFTRKVSRSVRAFFRSLGKDFQKVSKASQSTMKSLTKLQEETVRTRGNSSRQKLKPSNYFNPVFWCLQSLGFLVRYLTSRLIIPGLQGLPALAGFVAPLLAGIWLTPSTGSQVSHATSRMAYFAEQREFETADFYARQLCFLKPNTSSALLSRAILLDEMDKSDDARAIAVSLVNNSEYLPAAEWLCGKDFEETSELEERDEQRDANLQSSLTWILARQPDHIQANMMLGTLHLAHGQYTSAIPPLTEVTNRTSIPEAWYSLAVAQFNLGRKLESVSSATVASDLFLERRAQETTNAKLTVQTLKALSVAGRHEEAAAVVVQTLPNAETEDAAKLRWLLGEVYAQWSRKLRTKPARTTTELAQAINLTYKALSIAPSNPVVTDELVQLSCSEDFDDKTMEQQLQVALNSGVSPGLVHFILGTRILLSDSPDQASAMQHFELASAHSASMPGLLNNMADAMADWEDANLDQALQLINQALVSMPDQAHFHDTKGKILLRMNQPLKAIASFEKALAAPEIRVVVHQKMAEAYGSLGNEIEQKKQLQMADNEAKIAIEKTE